MNTPKTGPLKREMELPLRVGPQIETGIQLHSIHDSDGSRIALEVFTPHAHQIVNAVNSHDRLVGACQRLVQWADALESEASQGERTAKSPPIIEAEAALAAAQP